MCCVSFVLFVFCVSLLRFIIMVVLCLLLCCFFHNQLSKYIFVLRSGIGSGTFLFARRAAAATAAISCSSKKQQQQEAAASTARSSSSSSSNIKMGPARRAHIIAAADALAPATARGVVWWWR